MKKNECVYSVVQISLFYFQTPIKKSETHAQKSNDFSQLLLRQVDIIS